MEKINVPQFLNDSVPTILNEYLRSSESKNPINSSQKKFKREALLLIRQYFSDTIDIKSDLYQKNIEDLALSGTKITILIYLSYIQEYGFTEQERIIHSEIPENKTPKEVRGILIPIINKKDRARSYLWRMLDEEIHELAIEIDSKEDTPSFQKYLQSTPEAEALQFLNEKVLEALISLLEKENSNATIN